MTAEDRERAIETLTHLLTVMDTTDDDMVRVMAADRVLDMVIGKPRRERTRQTIDPRPFVVFADDFRDGEPGFGHNGGPALERGG